MKKFGILGKNISYTLSPFLQKELVKTFNLSKIDYEIFDIPQIENLKLEKILEFDGLNITMPYKEKIIKHLENNLLSENNKIKITKDKIVGTLNSANTILINKNNFEINNTDYLGFKQFLKEKKITENVRTVAILGNGSTAKMCKAVLEKNFNKKVVIISRIEEEKSLLKNYTWLKNNEVELIINTTPLGQGIYRGSTPIDREVIKKTKKIIDFNYSPYKSKLLKIAFDNGIENYSGIHLLVRQGVKSFLTWNEMKISSEENLQICENLVRKCEKELKKNILIYGMPLAGKTYLYKKVYFDQLLDNKNVKIFDLDLEIEKKYNLEIKEIIQNYGIEKFREIEFKVLSDLVKQDNSTLIFAGGGLLTYEKNLEILGTTKLIYMNIELKNLLERTNKENLLLRPLLKNKQTYTELYQTRHKKYLKYADLILKDNEEIIKEINEYFNNKRT